VEALSGVGMAAIGAEETPELVAENVRLPRKADIPLSGLNTLARSVRKWRLADPGAFLLLATFGQQETEHGTLDLRS
jgi:hypothetical protein